MNRPRSFTEQHASLAVVPLVFAALVPAAFVFLAVKAAESGWKAARRAVDRHVAQIDRAFARHCTERLQALRGAPPSVWRRALRELARERREQEDAREALCDTPSALARRAAARVRRDEAWRAWFTALEQAVAGAGTPSRELLRGNPLRRGAPIRRLCERSVNPPPTGAALLEQYGKARGRGRVEEKIRLGSMLLDAEASVDSSLIRDEGGEIVGRRPGLRGWLADNCPALLRHYGALLGYRRLAAELREAHEVGDPCPATLLLAQDAAAETKLPPAQRAALPQARKQVRKRLRETGERTVKAFAEALHRSWAEQHRALGKPQDRLRRQA